ncbi:MAG TPA: OmpA family protein [Ignavibacteria bacterium]
MKIIFSILFIISISATVLYSQDEPAKKTNLGPNVNSKSAELNPVISADGKTLYFTRRNHPENMGYGKTEFDDDIWISELDNNGGWTPAKNAGYPLNNNCFSSICSVSPDGTKMLLQGIFDKTVCKKNSDELYLYTSEKNKNGWSIPKKLNIPKFFNKNIYADFFLSNDGKFLLMAIENIDSYGDLDIYVSILDENNEWNAPLNLGIKVNTNLKEYSPFLAADNVSLYFSSKGHEGFGDADVFVARRLDDTWKNWSEPENLGQTINTSGADAYYVIPASGDFAYFVSTDNSIGAEDIFRVLLPGKVKPNPVVLISGKVIDVKTKQPIEADIVYELPPDGGILGSLKTNPENGEFKLTLPVGHNYGFRVNAKGYIFAWETFDAKKFKDYTEAEKIINLTPIEEGTTTKLNNIYFELGKSDLKTESYSELDKVVKFLNENPGVRIEISGHTDSTGNDIINDTLSENRAKNVRKYIVSNGIYEDRISYKGYGSKKPVASNDTPEGMRLNRRVEFTILEMNYVSNVKPEKQIIENKIPEENKIIQNVTESPQVICITYFELNQTFLLVRNYSELEKAVTYLKDNPNAEIEISGHSDNTGGKEDANLKVSEIIAKAVREYIISRNISENRITVKSYGSKNPVSSNDTEQGRNLNRRVEIIILKK